MKFLLVEDDVDRAKEIKKLLEFEGAEIIVAEDSFEGQRLLNYNKVDACLCDLNLPDRDAWDFAKAIRLDEKISGTLLWIYSSARQNEESVQMAMARGATGCIPATDPRGIVDFVKRTYNL
jgi:CheY-like chemotaxis protein